MIFKALIVLLIVFLSSYLSFIYLVYIICCIVKDSDLIQCNMNLVRQNTFSGGKHKSTVACEWEVNPLYHPRGFYQLQSNMTSYIFPGGSVTTHLSTKHYLPQTHSECFYQSSPRCAFLSALHISV